MLGAHLLVVLEAAGGDEHAAAGVDVAACAVVGEHGAGDGVVGADEFVADGVAAQLDAGLLGQGEQQAAEEGLSAEQAAGAFGSQWWAQGLAQRSDLRGLAMMWRPVALAAGAEPK